MTRPAARITYDEVSRLIKAVKNAGLPIAAVTFDGDKVQVIIGSGEVEGFEARPAEVEIL